MNEAAMTSKVKLSITLEGEGEVVELLADVLREFFRQPPKRRLEDVPPAVSISPRRNGHARE
jgi:hypothetical protein